jgi:hypothetical protein
MGTMALKDLANPQGIEQVRHWYDNSEHKIEQCRKAEKQKAKSKKQKSRKAEKQKSRKVKNKTDSRNSRKSHFP